MNVDNVQNNYIGSDSILPDYPSLSKTESQSDTVLDSSDSVDYQPYFINIVDDFDLISKKYSDQETLEISEDITLSELNHTLQWTNTLFIVLILVLIGRSISNRVRLM